MTNKLIYGLLFCTGLAQAFDGAPTFATTSAGVAHMLALSHWKVDKRGVPSFDFVYEQHAGACRFRLAGHADAVTEEVHGKVEPAVYNPEDDQGRAMPQIVVFDSDDVAFSLPYKGALNKISLRSALSPALKARACDKGNDEGLTVDFRK